MDQHDGTGHDHDGHGHDGHGHDGHGQDDEGTQKPGGLGEDGTIPPDPDGLGATTTGEQSTFEPEEDEAAPDGV